MDGDDVIYVATRLKLEPAERLLALAERYTQALRHAVNWMLDSGETGSPRLTGRCTGC